MPSADHLCPLDSDSRPLAIASYRGLLERETEIVARINRVEGAGYLFQVHPFRLLADLGVELSEAVRAEIIALHPELSGLSESPYLVLRSHPQSQSVRIRVRGLFLRKP